ncbi:MAG: ABC transporter permease [Bosea sp.]|jgi:peptide/nickel transport system permease protein|nr:ABC transporter permease [Bosea sp. (in: a-proteobacteria)]
MADGRVVIDGLEEAQRFALARRFLANRSFLVGGLLFLSVVAVALSADLIAPFDPLKNNFRYRLGQPNAAHLFGTDSFGRDILSRVLHGSRVSLFIGLLVVLLTGVFGTLIGAVSGYVRSLDNLIMRIMDGFMAFPPILLAIAVGAVLGPSLLNAVIALTVAYTPRTARIVRASVLVVREAEYVEAARALGAGHVRILFRHILANCMAPLLVQLTFIFALSILAEAVLSFIGVGPPPPTPTFGNIIADGRNYIAEAPWITIWPGIAIMATVLGLNLMGDGLRDVLDPRLKHGAR